MTTTNTSDIAGERNPASSTGQLEDGEASMARPSSEHAKYASAGHTNMLAEHEHGMRMRNDIPCSPSPASIGTQVAPPFQSHSCESESRPCLVLLLYAYVCVHMCVCMCV